MELRWKNNATREIGVAFVTDDDALVLRTVGYEYCNDEDFTDDEKDGELVEVWKPCRYNGGV